jgi:hypothetical protein
VYTHRERLKPSMYVIRVHGSNGATTRKLMVQ